MEAVVELPARDAADPAAARTLAVAAEAVPLLQEAMESMRAVLSSLDNRAFVDAVREEAAALRALNRAIERFAGLRDLIELAYADQGRVVALLTPPEDEEDVAQMSAEDRARMVGAMVGDNRERLGRMEPLLAESLGEAAAGAEDAEADPGARERYERAEGLRAAALDALEALTSEIGRAGAPGASPSATAREALGHLEELRRLFFSIVEHLQALLAEQTGTHDRTATLQFESQVDELVPELGLVGERQGGHAALADALGEALAQQARTPPAEAPGGTPPDGADAPGGPGAEPAAAAAEAAAEAAGEVRAAAGRMHAAGAVIDDAVQRAASMSPDLEPALADQLGAIEHLENAIRLLQPPQEGEGGGETQQAGAQAAQAQQPDDPERMSQRQALRRLQAIRDRDAQRQRERRDAGQPEPVEKDW